MYNVYKHWGSETAQYGLEIIFNGTFHTDCQRCVVPHLFLAPVNVILEGAIVMNNRVQNTMGANAGVVL